MENWYPTQSHLDQAWYYWGAHDPDEQWAPVETRLIMTLIKLNLV